MIYALYLTLFTFVATVLGVPAPQDSPTPTIPAAATHTVEVGGAAGLVFTPSFVTADVSDVIVFQFMSKNHSASQSTFDAPCVVADGGFDSGFMPVAANATEFPTFNVTVQSTDPIFVHCHQVGHCGAGMVFAVNPDETQPSTTSFEIFKARAMALNGTEGPTATAPAPTPAATHTVTVGGAQLLFNPPFVSADPQDVIVFQFMAKNHTASQGSFNAPCDPLTDAYGNPIGFDSGFMPVAANATEFPTFNVTVQDFNPIFVHCRQTAHCGLGMVFAVNPDERVGSQQTYELYKAAAIATAA